MLAEIDKRTRRSAIFALSCLTLVLAACRSAAPPLQPLEFRAPLPAATPAMSLAGAARFPCVLSERPFLAIRFKSGRPTYLDFGSNENGKHGARGGIAHAIAREFGCHRRTIEIELPLLDLRARRESRVSLSRDSVVLLETLLVVPSAGVSLWSIADDWRLGPRGTFAYGAAFDLSEDEAFLLSVEPKGSSLRLMLVYRLDL